MNSIYDVFLAESFDLVEGYLCYLPYLFGGILYEFKYCCYNLAEVCSTVVILNCLVFINNGLRLLPADGVLICKTAKSLSKSSSSIFFPMIEFFFILPKSKALPEETDAFVDFKFNGFFCLYPGSAVIVLCNTSSKSSTLSMI